MGPGIELLVNFWVLLLPSTVTTLQVFHRPHSIELVAPAAFRTRNAGFKCAWRPNVEP